MSENKPDIDEIFPHYQVAMGAVGLTRRALEEATKYSMERKAFGKPICEVSQSITRFFCQFVHCWLFPSSTKPSPLFWLIWLLRTRRPGWWRCALPGKSTRDGAIHSMPPLLSATLGTLLISAPLTAFKSSVALASTPSTLRKNWCEMPKSSRYSLWLVLLRLGDFNDLYFLQIYEGTAQIQRLIISREVLAKAKQGVFY